MAYAPESYALGFEGDCALKRDFAARGIALPMQSPYATGAPVDWDRHQETARPGPPAGRHDCEAGHDAAHARDEL